MPLGRTALGPRLYTTWLAFCSWTGHLFSGEPLAIAAEQAALWEPVISHAVASFAAVALFGARFGTAGAVSIGLLFALFPPLLAQFLPGVLTPRTWALLFAAAALAPRGHRDNTSAQEGLIDTGGAVAAALSLWLSPAIGVPVVLIAALAGATASGGARERVPFVRWSAIGASITVLGWVLDRSPWDLAAGELRYVHPLYGFAWLGLGLALAGWKGLRHGNTRRIVHGAAMTAGAGMVLTLVYIQVSRGYLGWLYPSSAMRRLSSLDETQIFTTMWSWLADARVAETLLATAPLLTALAMLALAVRCADSEARRSILWRSLPLLALAAWSCLQIRTTITASLVAVGWIGAHMPSRSAAYRNSVLAAASVFLGAACLAGNSLPLSLRRSADAVGAGPGDIQALVHRHFARWMAAHHPRGSTAVLASPALSDSLVFHGGSRVLLSTAWESYPGQVAASRILSAPEATEAHAVIESRGLTHLALPSWDRVVPLLVKAPLEAEKTTLWARLDVWKLPPYLRPLPYHLPPAPGYESEKLAVFKVVPPQDEALLLSRLAEYFLEMNRNEPAALAAQVLADAYADDPNATAARATVWAQQRKASAFERELGKLAAGTAAGLVPDPWDRRVQRAIVLAIGRRHELARPEIEACLRTASLDVVYDLTPLQAHRLATLAKRYSLDLPDSQVAATLASLASEYGSSPKSLDH